MTINPTRIRHLTFIFSIGLLAACSKPSPGPDNGNGTAETLGDPVINAYFPSSGNVGDTILIIGQNFSKLAKNNQVSFNPASAIPLVVVPGAKYDTMEVIVPSGANTGRLTVSVLSKTATGKDTFWITTGKWIRRADFPAGGRANAMAFGIGRKGYLGFGVVFGWLSQQDLWEYDPDLDHWTRKADCPSCPATTSFVVNNKAYVGFDISSNATAANQFYTYDPTLNSWSLKGNVNGEAITDAVSFVAANKGYITSNDFSFRFLMYDPSAGTWTQKNNFPVPRRSLASGFVINDELYLGGGHWDSITYKDLWKYSPALDKWTQLANAYSGSFPLTSFSLNGKGYWLLGNSYKGSGFYEYDPATNTWSMKKAFPGSAYKNEMSFVANNRAFVTGGIVYISAAHDTLSAETWEFVP